MRPSVRAKLFQYNEPLEGSVPFLYLDVLGLVTTAVGVLVDPIGMVYGLPFQNVSEGRPATANELAEDWSRVKLRPDLKLKGGMAYKSVAKLRLTREGIEQVTLKKADQFVRQLRSRFPEWDTWPADAQLAVMSLTWACGAAFRFPKLASHLQAQDWASAATECDIAKDHGTIKQRNEWQRLCFRNAATVVAQGLDRETLYWPGNAFSEVPDERLGGGMLAIEGIVDGLKK